MTVQLYKQLASTVPETMFNVSDVPMLVWTAPELPVQHMEPTEICGCIPHHCWSGKKRQGLHHVGVKYLRHSWVVKPMSSNGPLYGRDGILLKLGHVSHQARGQFGHQHVGRIHLLQHTFHFHLSYRDNRDSNSGTLTSRELVYPFTFINVT